MTRLFVYGSLMRRFPTLRNLRVSQHLEFISTAKMGGRIYNVGEFPAAIQDDTSEHFVYGELLKVHDAKVVLRKLDEYEEVDVAHPDKGLFVRKIVKVFLNDDKTADAWTYLYNKPLRNAVLIASGDYRTTASRRKVASHSD